MEFIRKKIYALIFWRSPIGEVLGSIYDIYIHLKYDFNLYDFRDSDNFKHHLIKEYHVIEKGLALPNPRPGFGQLKVSSVIKKAIAYESKNGKSQLTSAIRACIRSYLDFNNSVGFVLPDSLLHEISSFLCSDEETDIGGKKHVKQSNIYESANVDFESFVKSRHSIRNFSELPVDIHKIRKAVDIAKYAPSVCNRQGWHAHVYSDSEVISKLLMIQEGSGGFNHTVDKVIVVTGNVKAFSKFESNQIFVDGGLFAMNLMLSLHNQGIGNCPLSTGFSYIVERNFKEIADIPEHERLIVMLAIGNMKEEFNVAVSVRKPTSDILFLH